MANVISNVKDYKVVTNNGFQFNVDVYGVNNFGNRKWMLRAVKEIREFFSFTDGADEGLIVNVIVNTHEIIVKAEFNGKKYFAFPIQPRYGKNQIKDILDDMGVVKDVIDVYTNNMVNSNNNMEENNMVNNVDLFNSYIMDDVLVKDFNYAVESAEVFANEYGDFEYENEHICGDFEYDYDIRKMWADWCWENDVMSRNDAYKYYDANRDMFINEDDLCECVYGFEDTYGVGIDDNCCGSCLIWVKNPYYVAEDMVKNDAPCLDEDEYDDNEWSDRDWLIKKTADTIKDYLGNYMPSYLDQFGDCVITVYWDEFSEDMMKNMIEDDNFALQVKTLVYGVGGIEGFLVYDDGIYVTVDYDRWFNKVA